jgi:hypothetical protein
MLHPWDDLPNAKHIDFVLEHVQNNKDKWNSLINMSCSMAWDDAIGGAGDRRVAIVLPAAKSIAVGAKWEALRAAWDAIVALVTYADCAYLLYADPREVELLAKLGVPAAVLLFPACVAISSCNARQSAV